MYTHRDNSLRILESHSQGGQLHLRRARRKIVTSTVYVVYMKLQISLPFPKWRRRLALARRLGSLACGSSALYWCLPHRKTQGRVAASLYQRVQTLALGTKPCDWALAAQCGGYPAVPFVPAWIWNWTCTCREGTHGNCNGNGESQCMLEKRYVQVRGIGFPQS